MSSPAKKPSSRHPLAILFDSNRRGGVRVVRVRELERYEGLSGSLCREVNWPREHYLPWARMSTGRSIRAKLIDCLTNRARHAQAPEPLPEARRRVVWKLRRQPKLELTSA